MNLLPRIIPCLDVRDGRVVKGIKFQNLRDAGDPVQCALAYQEQGADELCVLDVSATVEGRGHGLQTIQAIRKALNIPLLAGGGVRTVADARALLDAGADKVATNTAAFLDPDLITQLATQFGRQCTVIAVDAARNPDGPHWHVVIRGGRENTGRNAVDWIHDAQERGAGEVLLTSWDRDGTREGYDLCLLRAVRKRCHLPLIASGGAAHTEHLAKALRAGADAVLAASIFHDQETTVADVKRDLQTMDIEVRS